MWSFRMIPATLFCAGLLTLSGCTVEPLNASRTNTQLTSGNFNATTAQILSQTEVAPVKSRVAQQIRNRLLFAMNGGQLQPGGRYRVSLATQEVTQTLSVQSTSLAPTSAQVRVRIDYALIDKNTGSVLQTRRLQSLASYDRTPQSFANQRSQRDAQNRAAQEIAEQLRLVIAQDVAKL